MNFMTRLFGGGKSHNPPRRESASENRRREMYTEFERVQLDAMVEAELHGRSDHIDYACDKAAKHVMRLYGLSLDELKALIKEGTAKWSQLKGL